MKKLRSAVKCPRKALFNQIPLDIAVIDRDFNIIEANKQFEKTYGDWRHRKCYELYKNRKRKCSNCPAVKTFRDGKTRVYQGESWDSKGNLRYYLVRISAYRNKEGEIPYIIEMSSDITDRVNLEKEYRLLFDNVPCYVTVIDRNFRVLDANELFRKTFSKKGSHYCYEMYKGRSRICANCPATKVFKTRKHSTSLQAGVDREGKKTHYMVTAAPLSVDGERVERVIEMALDVSEVMRLQERLKQVEQEKIEAERFAAVGQTVAGLAHGIKNILMGLEGGMYVVNSGMKRRDTALITSGWTMLQNNITKISTVVKEYLQFARGSEIQVQIVDPVGIAKEVFELFKDLAKQSDITLTAKLTENVKGAPMDPEGMHSCLSNLISNAIDACAVSDKRKKRIILSCYEKEGAIIYEVEDNGTGMDYEVKKKLFTNFFTTKASGQGTGLGLLVTRRIVHEHGGKIDFESTLGKGSLFRIELPRKRLPRFTKEEDEVSAGTGGDHGR